MRFLLPLLITLSVPGFAQAPVELHAAAPEFRDVDAWINSKPLTYAKLRGRVVVVHFWTFG